MTSKETIFNEAIDILRQVEWTEGLYGALMCPICGGLKYNLIYPPGHKNDCQLNIILAKTKKVESP